MTSPAAIIKSIDFRSLPVSDYNRSYIMRMLPAIDYYVDIYEQSLGRLLSRTSANPHDLVLVDYGGGHGFFSIVAKLSGIGRVVYVDINPMSVQAATAVKEAAGIGADLFLQGDSSTLRKWCSSQGVKPHMLAGFDVIEHIYRLEPFFADVFAINPHIQILFTTASNPCNPFVRHHLHKAMRADEFSAGGFRQLRRLHIAQLYPDTPQSELDRLADATRGLSFADIDKLLCNPHASLDSSPTIPKPPFPNTCDPVTGSWTERILPISAYRSLLAPYGRRVSVNNGFYNSRRRGAKGIASSIINPLLHLPATIWFAPFVFIEA